MRTMLLASGGLLLAIGLAHSVLGEVLIFRTRADRLAAPEQALAAHGRHRGIIRASWHIATVLGAALGLALISYAGAADPMPRVVQWVFAVAIGVSAALVLTGTKGRHPGWIALAAAAALCAMA